MSLTRRPWLNSVRSLLPTARSVPARKKARRVRRLFLAALEDRTLPSASILGSVWNDLLADGLRQAGEPGLAAVTVTLDRGLTHAQTLTTGAGDYSFKNLAAGTYTLGLVLPAGAALTFPGGGTTTRSVEVDSDGEVHGIDFGVAVAPTTIPNESVTSDPAAQQMPSVAVDPHDASHVVVAYMDYAIGQDGFAGIRVAVSHDGGASWAR